MHRPMCLCLHFSTHFSVRYFLFIHPLPRRPPSFPYTTLFRSEITLPFCVASNGPMSKIRHALGLTKLLNYFEGRSEEHTSELQSRGHLVCRLLLEKKNTIYRVKIQSGVR